MHERRCDISGTRKNSKAMSISKFGVRNRRVQEVNLQWRKLWWAEGRRFVKLRLSTRTLKTINKYGLEATARRYKVDLSKFAMSGGIGLPPKMKASELSTLLRIDPQQLQPPPTSVEEEAIRSFVSSVNGLQGKGH